ncbi:hypothetical protein SFC50_04530 [Bacillus infantis]|uniref:hypothetical protein n=1 Tax=Bacillus infantis TaxID=324767 RepID=UPI003982B902
MKLLKADVLKERFEVKAHFYKMKIDKEEYLMRSEARILRKMHMEEEKTDAIIVMINPGGCSAKNKNQEFSFLPKWGEEKLFVAAKPDQTQYQLMNLMERMRWNCITILNISDICTGNFQEFKKVLKKFYTEGYQNHSLFSEERKKELEGHLETCSTLIYAWGKSDFRPILEMADSILKKGFKNKGLKGEGPYFRHPKPALHKDRLEWLNEMELLLKES